MINNENTAKQTVAARGWCGDTAASQSSDAARSGRDTGAARDLHENRCTIRNREST